MSLNLSKHFNEQESSVLYIWNPFCFFFLLSLTNLSQNPTRSILLFFFYSSLISTEAIGWPVNSVSPSISTDIGTIGETGDTKLPHTALTDSFGI